MKSLERHKNIIASLIFTLALIGAAQAQEVQLLWSDTHNEVLARHNASLYTPVEQPANWIHESFRRGEAQQAIQKLYPSDRKVVRPITVESRSADQATVEEMTVDGRSVPLTERW